MMVNYSIADGVCGLLPCPTYSQDKEFPGLHVWTNLKQLNFKCVGWDYRAAASADFKGSQ